MLKNILPEFKGNLPEFRQGFPEFKSGSEFAEFGNMNTLGFGGTNGIPYKSDLVQHLFKSGETNVISTDGLYAVDFSGNGNHAPLKNSYMIEAIAGQTIDSIAIKTRIDLLSTDTFDFELYFQTNSVSTNEQFAFFGGVIGVAGIDSKINFRQGTGITLQGQDGSSITFANYTDFKTLRKYRFRYEGGRVYLFVNDVAIANLATNFTSWSFTTLFAARGVTNKNGKFFGLKLIKNDVLVNYWPCQSGAISFIHDVVSENHCYGSLNLTTLNFKATQNLLHYNIKYGADVITSYAGLTWYCPRKMDGTKLTNNPPNYPYGGGTVYTSWKWGEYQDPQTPWPICETTVETLNGDINFYSLTKNDNNDIFANVVTDKTFKDILVYSKTKTAGEVAKINKYTEYNTWDDFVYNKPILQTIRDIIKSGNARFATLGDSISPFTHRLSQQFGYYCSLKGLGHGYMHSGNYAYNIYQDVSPTNSGTYQLLSDGLGGIDEIGILGYCTKYSTGGGCTISVPNHKYTNIRILYAKNTGLGSFTVTIGGVTETVDCNTTQGLGIYTRDLIETGGNAVVLCTGTVYIYGFELNNTGLINHLLCHGGYSSSTFNSAKRANYISDYCANTVLDFGIIMLGANDASTPNSKAVFKTNITQIISDMRAGNANLPMILLSPTTRGLVEDTPGEDLIYWGHAREYYDGMKELSDALTNVCVVDTGLIFPRWDEAVELDWMDGVIHHKPVAQEWLSRILGRIFLNI